MSGTIVIGYNGALRDFTMSPLSVRTRGGVPRWIYSSLLRFNEALELEGDLAESWSVSPNGLVYEFRLRADATWHDGHPVTADDVVYTAGLLQQPHRYFRDSLLVDGTPAQFSAIDDRIVRVELPRRFSPFATHLTPVWGSLFLVVPRHLVESRGEAAFEQAPVGSGPFSFGRADADRLSLRANPAYFNGAPAVDEVEIRFFESNEARVAAFDAGDVDVLIFPGREYEARAVRAGARLHRTTTNTIVQLAMNCRTPMFADTRVRQGVAAAVNRPRLLQEIEGPSGVAAYSPVGPSSWAYDPTVNRHQYDPARAAALLDAAGWTVGRDGIRESGGRRFEFEILYPPDRWNYALGEWANGIAKHLSAVGIRAVPRPVSYWDELKPAWRAQDFDAFIYYDTFYVEPDLYWSWHSSMPRRADGPDAPAGLPHYGYGVPGYSNPSVDAALEAYRATTSRTAQLAHVREAQRIMADEVASLWLYNHQWTNVVKEYIGGLSAPTLADGTSDLIVMLRPERLTTTRTAGEAV
ncbi:ABC transporter substrate-binding protein [Microbacterium sp.]|uniref:ABC transporter substrate-binding protein n=1 Tax=Microbacterium sp. TaxID=51671 RepID=UPI0031FEBE2E|nr:ABC transporter substrate-binding protein [Microbacterium sp.]